MTTLHWGPTINLRWTQHSDGQFDMCEHEHVMSMYIMSMYATVLARAHC
jgi:hypothetical protein